MLMVWFTPALSDYVKKAVFSSIAMHVDIDLNDVKQGELITLNANRSNQAMLTKEQLEPLIVQFNNYPADLTKKDDWQDPEQLTGDAIQVTIELINHKSIQLVTVLDNNYLHVTRNDLTDVNGYVHYIFSTRSDLLDTLAGYMPMIGHFQFPQGQLTDVEDQQAWTESFVKFIESNIKKDLSYSDLQYKLGQSRTQFAGYDKQGQPIGTYDFGYTLLFRSPHTVSWPFDKNGFMEHKLGAQLVVKTDPKTNQVKDYSLSYLDLAKNLVITTDMSGKKTYLGINNN
jgi:hypothetical protein